MKKLSNNFYSKLIFERIMKKKTNKNAQRQIKKNWGNNLKFQKKIYFFRHYYKF